MIKINLLEEPGVRDVGMEEAPSSASFQVKVLLPCVLAALAILGSLYGFWSHRIHQANDRLVVEQREAARLAAIQAENQRYEREVQERQARIQTIQALENSRTGPVELMQLLAASVNRTLGLYLLSVSSKNGRLGLDGGSPSVDSIADLITALEKAGSFGDVQLHQYYEDDRFDQVHFRFNLDCVYQPRNPAVAATPAVAPAAPAAAAHATGK
jgi:Tfp pilus assembly protein PilN